jgi:Calx-beta domain-containing protein
LTVFAPTFQTVNEDAGQVTVTFTWQPNGSSAKIFVYTRDGTAVAGSDYTALSVDAGHYPSQVPQSYTYTISLIDDYLQEPDQTFTVFSDARNQFGTNTFPCIITIHDSDTGVLQPNGNIEGPPTPA